MCMLIMHIHINNPPAQVRSTESSSHCMQTSICHVWNCVKREKQIKIEIIKSSTPSPSDGTSTRSKIPSEEEQENTVRLIIFINV